MPEEIDNIIIEVDEIEEEVKIKRKLMRVLAFALGSENYCIDIKQAKEVIIVNHVTKVPGAPDFIYGVINLRGEVVALCDIKYFLGLNRSEHTGELCAIVTDANGSTVSILVDRVLEAFDIEEGSVQPPLATLNGSLSRYTVGQIEVGGNIFILLDLKKILTCDDMEILRKGEK